MNFFTMRASGSARTMVPRASRMNLLDRLIMPWRLPAAADLTLPEAVILKRFLQDDFVFILGILLLHFETGRHQGRRGLLVVRPGGRYRRIAAAELDCPSAVPDGDFLSFGDLLLHSKPPRHALPDGSDAAL
jgi:hypothetical protein